MSASIGLEVLNFNTLDLPHCLFQEKKLKRKIPLKFGAKDKNEEIHSIGFSDFYETRN